MNLAITNVDINTKSPETKPVGPIRETVLIANPATSCKSSSTVESNSILRGFCGESRLLNRSLIWSNYLFNPKQLYSKLLLLSFS